LLEDFGVSVSMSTPLLCDSTYAINIARDPVKHELTKYIGVDVYYTQAQIQDGVIALQYVPSELQLAVFFMKADSRPPSVLSLQTQCFWSTMSLRGGVLLDV
jgi:hypothetical protein